MVMVKKSSGGGGAPSLDILAARLRIEEAELFLEPKEINLDNGRSFVSDPNLNCKLVVVKNLVEKGVHEGATFFDRFRLKEVDGEWSFAKYSKLGSLIKVRYGEDWFDDPAAEFEEGDFEGFEFVAQIEPKIDPKGNKLPGSVINWKGIRRVGSAEGAAEENVGERPSEADEDDFDDLPF